MVQRLQLIYGMRIILISCGSFYISIGADAIVLNKELGLKLNCAKKGVCKVGVPKSSIDRYIEKLDGLGYSYMILDYDKQTNKLIKISENQGKSIEETAFNNDCKKCDRRIYTVETEYEKALKEYLKEEFGENFYGKRNRKQITNNSKNRKIYRIYVKCNNETPKSRKI